jgi:hypothetical protein
MEFIYLVLWTILIFCIGYCIGAAKDERNTLLKNTRNATPGK